MPIPDLSTAPPDAALLWEDGAVVVQSDEGFWDGCRFIPGWGGAKKYRPCSPDHAQGVAEAEAATGVACWTVYLQPR